MVFKLKATKRKFIYPKKDDDKIDLKKDNFLGVKKKDGVKNKNKNINHKLINNLYNKWLKKDIYF